MDYEFLQQYLKILSDSNRLRIIYFIGNERKSVSEIIQSLCLPQPLVSHHLRVLKEGHILEPEREGVFIYYRITKPRLIETLLELQRIGNSKVCNERNLK